MSDRHAAQSVEPRVAPHLGELEALVMEAVWQQEDATVRTVFEALNAAGDRQRAYTTVMTVMHRLARKGLLLRRRSGRADAYAAVVGADEYRDARAGLEVAAVVERYGQPALVAFVRALEENAARLDSARRRRGRHRRSSHAPSVQAPVVSASRPGPGGSITP